MANSDEFIQEVFKPGSGDPGGPRKVARGPPQIFWDKNKAK